MNKNRRRDREREKERGPAPSVAALRAGPAPTIRERASGRVWRLGWNTTDAKAALEMVIVSQLTIEAVERMESMNRSKPGSGDTWFQHFENRVNAGQYKTFAPGWRFVLAGLDASWIFLLSLLHEHQPDATPGDAKRLLADEPHQVHMGVSTVAPDFFAAVAIQLKDKSVPADAAAEAGRAIATAILERNFGTKGAPPLISEPTAEPGTG